MVGMKIFAFAALAIGAIAAPVADSKSFKVGVTIGSKTLYLTGTDKSSENIADGIACKIVDTAISCGADNKGYDYNPLHPFEGALVLSAKPSNNKGWAIDADNKITWKTSDNKFVNFSTSAVGKPNEIFAEICSTYGHPDGAVFTPGVAKAYYV
ncbi:hypothetical protein BT63DRAFT_454288 [Microthyrium microscopicum]|uniref:Uncharacterized protein n=1 Tax=Microthyrium microscopicum TaxID=703497 RepID=A0A6A6UG94_9PEZI|nr:hypothetical protein BT63DRAFT_454288 [Microthyrium microscopicum]